MSEPIKTPWSGELGKDYVHICEDHGCLEGQCPNEDCPGPFLIYVRA